MFDACNDAFLLRKSVLILGNSADPDEMQPYMAHVSYVVKCTWLCTF